MNAKPLVLFFALVINCSGFAQQSQSFDLHKLLDENRISVYNREASLVNEKGYAGIHLSEALGEGVAWINGLEFSNGTIEFDVRGKNEKQHSFVGLAFHANDNEHYDAVYLRPFQFPETNAELRKRSIQYISLPDFTWRKLRENSPGKYENEISPSPNPDAWVHMKIEIMDNLVQVFINGNKEASLTVNKVTDIKMGSIGFYVADVSGGDFANLKVTKTN